MKKRFIFILAVLVLAGFVPAYRSQAADLAAKLKGRILLQVESKGEAWYVNPKDGKRYYMADGAAAYSIMRDLGVGITDKDLARIQSDKAYAKKQQGKIFLKIESHGEAYYIDTTGNAYYLADGNAAYGIMRELGLGIKTSDLIKIILSDKDKASTTPTSTVPIVDTTSFAVQISSSTCTYTKVADQYGNSVEHIRAIARGTVSGPVGTRLELPLVIWSDDKWFCGDWTYSPGAFIAVGGTCTRKEGQPTSTAWTVDTGGEEQGDWLKGKFLSYSAKVYNDGEIYSKAEDHASFLCQ